MMNFKMKLGAQIVFLLSDPGLVHAG